MRLSILLFSFLFAALAVNAQQKRHVISVNMDSEVDLPADMIRFNINLNAEGDSPQGVYGLHKKREKALVQLLDKYDIRENDIRYEPISISKRYDRGPANKNEPSYQTSQTVSLTLKDFDKYEKIQVGLIQHDFDNFNGIFSSSKVEEGRDQALKKAIQSAKEKAQFIARESDLELGGISQVRYSQTDIRPYNNMAPKMMEASQSDELLKYAPTVTVHASVSMDFQIFNTKSGE